MDKEALVLFLFNKKKLFYFKFFVVKKGFVYKAIKIDNDDVVAIKFEKKDIYHNETRTKLELEARILK